MKYSLCRTRSEVDRLWLHRVDKERKLQAWLSYYVASKHNGYLYLAGSRCSASRREPKFATSAENMKAAERILSVVLKDTQYDDLVALWTCLVFNFHLTSLYGKSTLNQNSQAVIICHSFVTTGRQSEGMHKRL